jgi:hypothetical protein
VVCGVNPVADAFADQIEERNALGHTASLPDHP